MACHLCKLEAPLKKSHIIPEFQYKPLYDKGHRFLLVSSDPKKRDRYKQKGIREYLLCGNCEQLFSAWEDYSYKVLFGDTAHVLSNTADTTRLGNIDYVRFKLFLMSLLWRMSVATGEHWRDVSLGEDEEFLRSALLSSNPLSENDYPCILTGVLIDGKFELGWFLPPSLIEDPHRCFRVVINGVLFTYFIPRAPSGADLGIAAISKKGEMTFFTREARSLPFVSEAITQIGTANRDRASFRR